MMLDILDFFIQTLHIRISHIIGTKITNRFQTFLYPVQTCKLIGYRLLMNLTHNCL